MISSGEVDLMIFCLNDSAMNKRAIRLKSPRYVLFVRSLVAIKNQMDGFVVKGIEFNPLARKSPNMQ